MSAAEDVAIIIPTLDNVRYLDPCAVSIIAYTRDVRFCVLIVNNGRPGSLPTVPDRRVRVLEAGGNRGWEGGLQLGLEHTDAPYVLFMNDDTHVPGNQAGWLRSMLAHFEDPRVGAVGPRSNCAAGTQGTTCADPSTPLAVPYLIGFCMLVRRSALAQVGGVAQLDFHGDDVDLSIRLIDAGYTLLIDRGVFIYHHGFKVGTRLHGAATVPGGYNSAEWNARTVAGLVARHGAQRVARLADAPVPYKPPGA